MTVLGTVAELWRYPVSSTGGERLEAADLAPRGVPGDRLWGVVDMRNGDVAGPERRRHWRPMPTISSRLIDGHPHLREGEGEWTPVGSPEADALVSRRLGFEAETRPHAAFGSQQDGHVAPRYDRADLHVLTTASMRRLADLIGNAAEIDSRRFRPNIVIETGADFDGFAEHALVGRSLAIGAARITISRPCARCSFTALAQGGLAFRPDVLHKIAQHGEGGFGVLCKVDQPGRIGLGDSVGIVKD